MRRKALGRRCKAGGVVRAAPSEAMRINAEGGGGGVGPFAGPKGRGAGGRSVGMPVLLLPLLLLLVILLLT